MRIAVIGSGIQGSSVALEAARRGVHVTMIDDRPRPMDGASLHTEGKIHLGFVYAKDRSLATSELMARGAACFPDLVSGWLGLPIESLVRSSTFVYAVHKKSMMNTLELGEAYAAIGGCIAPYFTDGEYFGIETPHVVTEIDPLGYGDAVAATFMTHEIAIEPRGLATAMRQTVLEHPYVTFRGSERVSEVDATRRTITTTVATLESFDHVVNCAWQGRPSIDRTAGIAVPEGVHRMKYFMRSPAGSVEPGRPSTTVVLGGFGDVVVYGDGSVFLSWYPVGRRGISTDITPPVWPDRLDAGEAARVGRAMLDGLGDVVPDAADLARDWSVDGGYIYAVGQSDIDDTESLLHARDRSGVTSYGSYHSVDTGKYTTAPLFAVEAVRTIVGDDRGT